LMNPTLVQNALKVSATVELVVRRLYSEISKETVRFTRQSYRMPSVKPYRASFVDILTPKRLSIPTAGVAIMDWLTWGIKSITVLNMGKTSFPKETAFTSMA